MVFETNFADVERFNMMSNLEWTGSWTNDQSNQNTSSSSWNKTKNWDSWSQTNSKGYYDSQDYGDW